jgi:hypothetical protein
VADFDALVDELSADPNVAGLLLAGSRGRAALVRDDSDWDLYVFLTEGVSLDEYAERYPSAHGDAVEVILRSRRGIENEPAWNRHTFCHIASLLDRSGGWLAEALRAITRVDPATAAAPLDAYVNSYYRWLKAGSHFDAAESVAWFLEFAFAVEGRVRPFNKWLEWELDHHPLTASGKLPLARFEQIVRTADRAEQAALFRHAEHVAREHGLGDVIDAWEPDVPRLRGD